MSWLDIIQHAFAGVLLRIEARRKAAAWRRARVGIDLTSQAQREAEYQRLVREAAKRQPRS